MGIYALSQRSKETYDAAGKAMRDVFTVLGKKGTKVIWSVPKECSKYVKILDLPYLAGFLFFRAGKSDFIFFSIPENHIKVKIVKMMQRIKKYKIICFINDLNAFRYGEADSEVVKVKMREEARAIGSADYVLIPNVNTAELLKRNGVTSKMIPVEIWDYLMTEEQRRDLKQKQNEAERREDEINIAFAGNLNKSEFISKIKFDEESRIKFHLWGKISDEKKKKLPQCCVYHGVLKAEDVPQAVCTMDYGLVWDGTGENEIEGGLGEYLRYNNSHKCGLYLAAGIPTIVWEQAGMAHFVKENECGVCITSLSSLLDNIEKADYSLLKSNALGISEKLQCGEYLSKAFDKVLLGEK